MKKLMCVALVLSLITLSGVASRWARSDDEKTPTIKEVMQKLHKGPNADLAKLKKDLAADSLDWKDIQQKAKDFETYGAALPKNDPPKGDKEDWKKLTDSYYENAKVTVQFPVWPINCGAGRPDRCATIARYR